MLLPEYSTSDKNFLCIACGGWDQNSDFWDGKIYWSETLTLGREEVVYGKRRIRNYFGDRGKKNAATSII